MWNRFNLRTRIYAILTALIIITMGGGLVMVWYTYQIQRVLDEMTEKSIAPFQAAAELETALANQKGFVSYYLLDGDITWLQRLTEYRERFSESLYRAWKGADTRKKIEALENIQSEYDRYVAGKDQVIADYQSGARESGAILHQQLRNHFFKILELTEDFKKIQQDQLRQVREESHAQAKHLRIIAVSAVLAVLGLGSLLAFILAAQILGPIRRLAIKTDREGTPDEPINEVTALSRGVQDLIENIDHRQSELERSQEVLLQTEKLALVGKLAAGTAHSIRNPLTSVKMRLFSLSRSLHLDPNQQEDFDVISEAVDHVDTIVENFLGFSKPPRLKKRTIYPSDVIDLSVKLLEHRLRSYQVQLKVKRETLLPEIEADPEQLKEALINIILNACEAMKNGGAIEIVERLGRDDASKEVVILEISDNGPGIPKDIQDEVFQPFFTTKEEGTGLGLSISARIIAQHGGSIDLISEENKGATFVIRLPIKENHLEQDSYN